MINEDMQKTMQFILEQQAQLAASMQKFDERQGKAEERVTVIEDVVVRLTNIQVDQHRRMDEHHNRMDEFEETMQKIAAVQKETTERLNILVNTVERYISERRNGGSKA